MDFSRGAHGYAGLEEAGGDRRRAEPPRPRSSGGVAARPTGEPPAGLLTAALEQSDDPLLIAEIDPSPSGPQIVYVNPAFCRLSGYSAAELVGAAPQLLHGPATDAAMVERLLAALRAGESCAAELVNYRKDGTPYRVACQITPIRDGDGRPTHYVSLQRNVSASQQREEQPDVQADYDLVTGLPNRYGFAELLEAAIAQATGSDGPFALCFIDLDRFNRINNTLGHPAGDALLDAVARRLRQTLAPAERLARTGGDEFALILPTTADEASALQTARRLLGALEAPFYVDGHELFVSASIGVALFPRDGADAAALLKNVDSALYRAKARGRNQASPFRPELGHAARARLALDNQLRRAIDRGQFGLHYQPQIDLRRGTLVGVESLIRWHHPERGLLAPAEFIAVAEDSYLMSRIADWVLAESCTEAMRWRRQGLPPCRMAVNLSARQFEEGEIMQRTAAALAASGLEPQWLDLEITESMLMSDPKRSARKIAELRAMGVRITLDDFGTGYSSLAYLQKFSVDALKIDRSFVWSLGANPRDDASGGALVHAIVALAHSLGLDVLAEGVETPDQHMLLRAIGCDEAQGYLYARPLPPDEVAAALRSLAG